MANALLLLGIGGEARRSRGGEPWRYWWEQRMAVYFFEQFEWNKRITL